MTSSADRFSTTEDQLRALVSRGFRFLHPRDSGGDVLAVVGVRAHHNVVDVMCLHGERDAKAMRMPSNEKDVLAPTVVLWQATGSADTVLADLLALPDDRLPGSLVPHGVAVVPERPATGCWVQVRPGSTRWLATTG